MKLTKSNFNDFYKNQIVEMELKNITGGGFPPPDNGDDDGSNVPPPPPPPNPLDIPIRSQINVYPTENP
jgi:hypothetical protein